MEDKTKSDAGSPFEESVRSALSSVPEGAAIEEPEEGVSSIEESEVGVSSQVDEAEDFQDQEPKLEDPHQVQSADSGEKIVELVKIIGELDLSGVRILFYSDPLVGIWESIQNAMKADSEGGRFHSCVSIVHQVAKHQGLPVSGRMMKAISTSSLDKGVQDIFIRCVAACEDHRGAIDISLSDGESMTLQGHSIRASDVELVVRCMSPLLRIF
jgi:hypothetical protein